MMDASSGQLPSWESVTSFRSDHTALTPFYDATSGSSAAPQQRPQQQRVSNMPITWSPLATLASLAELAAEQERLLIESARRVYGHQMDIQQQQHPASSLQRQQPFNQTITHHLHHSPSSSYRSIPAENTINSEASFVEQVRTLAENTHRFHVHQNNSIERSNKYHQPLSTSLERPFINEMHQYNPAEKRDETLPMKTEITQQALSVVPLGLDVTSKDSTQRKMGRIRLFNEHSGGYGPWKDIMGEKNGTTITLNLSRGGRLRVLCNVLPQNKRRNLSAAMHGCKLYRQYSLSRNDRLNFIGFQEPRSHVLLSSRAKFDDKTSNDERPQQPGYVYHGINMKALPISLVPEVESYAEDLAKIYNIPHWDIGVDMIAYKDGNDSIGWHSDDTQGETIVVCVVVDAPEMRPLSIRPNKRKKPLCNGDEEIQLFIAEGDGYDMDGYMQENYEHSLPKKAKSDSHRFVLIFRQGNTGFVPSDSGVSVLKTGEGGLNDEDEEWDVVSAITKLRPKTDTVVFGHLSSVNLGECYSRRFLWSTFAHRADQKGINGNMKDGSDSIVVSRQNFDLREEDGLSWLRYTSSRRQGGGALVRSFRTRKPVRVFRSSNLRTSYRPIPFDGGRTSYRYDGLYSVTRIWNSEGKLTDSDIPGGEQFTFHLERMVSENQMTIDELFWKIQHASCFGPHFPFTIPSPKQDGDTLPALIQTTAEPESKQQRSSRITFQQPMSINHGAVVELERFIRSRIATETEHVVCNTCHQKDDRKHIQTPRPVTFTINETVYAYDKCNSGNGKSHNRWLSSNDMMKQTPLTRHTYRRSRSQPSRNLKTKTKSRPKLHASTKSRKRCSSTSGTPERKRKRRCLSKPSPQTFKVAEEVFAYDKKKSGGVLYEAKVIKLKELAVGCNEYFVHYKGYGKSHNRWLGGEELLKQTKHNRRKFEKSRM